MQVIIAGTDSGIMISEENVHGVAPSIMAASSISLRDRHEELAEEKDVKGNVKPTAEGSGAGRCRSSQAV